MSQMILANPSISSKLSRMSKSALSLSLVALAACGTGAISVEASAADVVRQIVAEQSPAPATATAQNSNVAAQGNFLYASPWPASGTVTCQIHQAGVDANYVVTLSPTDILGELDITDSTAQVNGEFESTYATDAIDSNRGLVAATSAMWSLPTTDYGMRNFGWVVAIDPGTYMLSASCGGEWAATTGRCSMSVIQSQCTYTP